MTIKRDTLSNILREGRAEISPPAQVDEILKVYPFAQYVVLYASRKKRLLIPVGPGCPLERVADSDHTRIKNMKPVSYASIKEV